MQARKMRSASYDPRQSSPVSFSSLTQFLYGTADMQRTTNAMIDAGTLVPDRLDDD